MAPTKIKLVERLWLNDDPSMRGMIITSVESVSYKGRIDVSASVTIGDCRHHVTIDFDLDTPYVSDIRTLMNYRKDLFDHRELRGTRGPRSLWRMKR